MAEFESKKWHFFVESPTSILKREFIKFCYLYIDSVSEMKVSEFLVIGRKDINFTYVKESDDKRNFLLAKEYLEKNKLEKIFFDFRKFIGNYKNKEIDPVKKLIKIWQELCPILVYTYYTERILTEKFQKTTKNKKYFERLLEENGKLREQVAKIGYNQYNKIYPYLIKKYKNFKEPDYCLLTELFSGRILSVGEIKRRKKFFVSLSDKNKIFIYTGLAAKAFLAKEKFRKIAIDKKVKEIKGLVAYSGEVTGKVVIIKKLADFKKDVRDKILVTPRTIIEYIPYLKKIKAIVTDIGGINSHAAISAREFKIPCIVDTKIASQVLRDGDLINVDAQQGIIRRMK